MTDDGDKPPVWADLLLTLWVLVVGVVYFGGYFLPVIGALTTNAAAFYAIMLLISVLVVTNRYLRRAPAASDGQNDTDTHTKSEKMKPS